MSDFFRILKGLELDEQIRVLTGTGAPGSTPDTDSSAKGSLYVDYTAGDLYLKHLAGTGPSRWVVIPTSVSSGILQMVVENAVAPVPPTPLGTNSIVIGSGAQTATSAPYSLAIGDQSLATIQGGVVQASGRFASSGDAQAGRYLLRSVTNNAFETELFVDGTGGSVRLVMPDDATWSFSAMITGHRTDATDGHAGFKIDGVIYRVAGVSSVAIQGKVSKDVIGRSNLFGGWDVNAYADTTNGSLKFTAIGQAGKTIRWVARVDTVEVTN